MKFPHVLRIHQAFVLGRPAFLKLAVQGLENGAHAYLYEMNPKFEWTGTQAVVSGEYLLVTSTPRLTPHYKPSARDRPWLDGGGDGTTTVIVTNPDGTDPSPPMIYTVYTEAD